MRNGAGEDARERSDIGASRLTGSGMSVVVYDDAVSVAPRGAASVDLGWLM
jgi:hypothetical protein